jgi:hypothetical protein
MVGPRAGRPYLIVGPAVREKRAKQQEYRVWRPACRDSGCTCGLRRERGRCRMSDLIYIGLALVFFGLSWAFVSLCERV